MLNIGCHMSISNGMDKAAIEIMEMGGNTFQFFTRNPRGGRARELKEKELEKLKTFTKENSFAGLLAHSAYTMNRCSDKEEVREFAKNLLADDIRKLNQIEIANLVFHPGSHVGQGTSKGIEYIVDGLNQVIDKDTKATILLETMSGKGTEIGRSFEELRSIIAGVKYNENLGICLDTCHAYSAGYDIVNDLDGVLKKFDKIIGLEKLKAIHLNDSMTEFASNKDRHAKIGEGSLGLDAFIRIINHPALKNLPYSLETPNDKEGYMEEIKLLKSNFK